MASPHSDRKVEYFIGGGPYDGLRMDVSVKVDLIEIATKANRSAVYLRTTGGRFRFSGWNPIPKAFDDTRRTEAT